MSSGSLMGFDLTPFVHQSGIYNSGLFLCPTKWTEGNLLFNNAVNTFYYGYMASDIW